MIEAFAIVLALYHLMEGNFFTGLILALLVFR